MTLPTLLLYLHLYFYLSPSLIFTHTHTHNPSHSNYGKDPYIHGIRTLEESGLSKEQSKLWGRPANMVEDSPVSNCTGGPQDEVTQMISWVYMDLPVITVFLQDKKVSEVRGRMNKRSGRTSRERLKDRELKTPS